MTKEREALKLALEALEELNNTNSYWWQEVDKQTIEKIEPAITAIKKALAQPEQEQQIETLKRCLFQMQEAAKDLVKQAKSLPSPQRIWDELTLAEVKEAYNQHAKHQIEDMGVSGWVEFADALQTILRNKNT